jgi:hypothetical protein
MKNDSASFFEADLPPDELEQILYRIEENLAFRQILKTQASALETVPLFPIPSLADFESRLQQLKALKAPLFRPEETQGGSALARRILNLPLRLFGFKQQQFNDELLALLADTVLLFHQTLLDQYQVLASYQQKVQRLTEQQQKLEQQLLEQGIVTPEFIQSRPSDQKPE